VTEATLNDPIAGNVKSAMKAAGAGSSDLWFVPVDQLHVDPTFNVRDHDEAYEAHIAWLTGQISTNGYDRSKPMTGYVVEGNVIYITDGHSRLAAVKRAIAAGIKVEKVPVIVHPNGTSALDLVASLVTANSGRPLTPLETAKVCKRMLGLGLDEGEIASRLNYSKSHVVSILGLLAAPAAVRDLVATGQVSASLAVDAIKQHGSDAAGKLQEAVTVAKAKGKKRATATDVSGHKPRMPKEIETLLRQALGELYALKSKDNKLMDKIEEVLK
jgi:ParB family chromosome partitioning protein